jgi:hypothetical protein
MASALERWITGYLKAWNSNEPSDIAALFSETAEYRSYPWAAPAVGPQTIVALWLSGADEAGDHEFTWHPLGADGGRHFVQGRTVYADGRVYENLWIVDLDGDGRCVRFTEWYMESASKPLGPGATLR